MRSSARISGVTTTRSLIAIAALLCQPFGVAALWPQAAQVSTRAAWTIPSTDTIRSLLARRPASKDVGVVVGVIEPAGRRVIAYGESGAPNGRLDGETVFQIGSVTKVFTSLLLAQAVVRGEVGLEDPAAKFLPSGVHMPQRGRPITLIDLSKHWSGLPSMPTNFSLSARPNPYEAYSDDQLYDFLNRYAPPREPGTQAYSNLGVALLGRLLARHAGIEYEALLRQRVLTPLGLRSTSITVSADQESRLAPGHDRFGLPVETWNLVAMPASGSLRSTVNDLLTFLEFNLGIRSSELDSAMLLQRTPGRALGWGRSTLAGDGIYSHEGGKEGYRSAVTFNPRTRTGVVVITNARTDDSPMDLARYLLLGTGAPPPAVPLATRPKSAPVARAFLDGYAGRYRVDSSTVMSIARRDDHLWISVLGDGVATFFPSAPDVFVSNTSDVTVLFERDVRGHITGCVMRAGSQQQRATRLSSANETDS